MPLTTSDVRKAIETDADETALSRWLAAAQDEVARRIGEEVSSVILYLDGSSSDTLFLPYRVDEVTEIAEVDSDGVEDDPLTADDWWQEGLMIHIVPSRTWSRRVRVTVKPISGPVRDRVVLSLVQLYLEHRPVQSESFGGSSRSSRTLNEERESILATLDAGRGLGVA